MPSYIPESDGPQDLQFEMAYDDIQRGKPAPAMVNLYSVTDKKKVLELLVAGARRDMRRARRGGKGTLLALQAVCDNELPPGERLDELLREGAMYDIWKGQPARKAIEQNQVTDADHIKELMYQGATVDIKAGKLAPEAIEFNGITDEKQRADLRCRGVIRDLQKGMAAPEAVQRHGITDKKVIARLYYEAALTDVNKGEPASEVMKKHGLTELERTGPVGKAAEYIGSLIDAQSKRDEHTRISRLHDSVRQRSSNKRRRPEENSSNDEYGSDPFEGLSAAELAKLDPGPAKKRQKPSASRTASDDEYGPNAFEGWSEADFAAVDALSANDTRPVRSSEGSRRDPRERSRDRDRSEGRG
jgi:hypothetical protein